MLLYRCVNKGCKEVLSLLKLNLHYLICDNLFINCPFKGCDFKGKEGEILSHKVYCDNAKVTCYICFKVLSQQSKLEHNCLSSIVEEVVSLERELVIKHSKYVTLLSELTTETKELLQKNKSLFRYCKTCFTDLSWLNYLKPRNDCEEGNCVKRSRYFCEDCSYFYCVKCVSPPRNLTCGCKQEMESINECDDNKLCDICGEELIKSFYRCEDCDYDICSNCY